MEAVSGKDTFRCFMYKYKHQYILGGWTFQLRSHLALIASHGQFTWRSFITFWNHTTVHRWWYVRAIDGHLPVLPVHSAPRLCGLCTWRRTKTFFYSNSSASFALRSLLSSWSPAIRGEHTLPINNDLNVFNKRLHTTSALWLQYQHPNPSLLSQLVIQ